MKELTEGLNFIKSLQYLDISFNAISDETAAILSHTLENKVYLQYLDLKCCGLSAFGTEIISQAVQKLPRLKEVDVRFEVHYYDIAR